MREIVTKIPMRKILALATGFKKAWHSSACDVLEKEKVTIYFSDGTCEDLPYSYTYIGYADKTIGDRSKENYYRIYDFVKEKASLIEKVEKLYKRYYDGELEVEELEVIYPDDNLNIEEIKKRIIEKIESSNEEQILFYYYKIFSHYCIYSDYADYDK